MGIIIEKYLNELSVTSLFNINSRITIICIIFLTEPMSKYSIIFIEKNSMNDSAAK